MRPRLVKLNFNAPISTTTIVFVRCSQQERNSNSCDPCN